MAELRELPRPAQLGLRGNPSDGFLSACRQVLGAAPPLAANAVVSLGARDILWLGPDEWLVVAAAGEESEIVPRLRSALAGIHSAVVDLSASRTVLELSGRDAAQILAQAATLDFHLRAFAVGACAQTNIARTQGIIQRTGEQAFRVFVRASFARYLGEWLRDAMASQTA